MTGFVVSIHAAERWRERVNPQLTTVEAIAEIQRHAAVIALAIEFGCRFVKLGTKERLVIEGDTIVTVLPPPPRRRRRGA